MSTPLPDKFKPHLATVRALRVGGGMGGSWADPRDLRGFTEDERKLVAGADGTETVSASQHHIDFDEDVPLGSLVTVWPGLPGEREAQVIAIGRHQHPRLPSYQTLFLA